MYQEVENKMNKAVAFYEEELATIRAGRATAAVLDKISVDYYGAATPIAQIGSINSPDPHTLLIQPWDASVLKEIEKAILKSDLGLNPNNDGKCIRLSFPPLTEERRKELVKSINKKTEEAKVAVRNVRRDALEDFKKQKKEGSITEDDLKDIEKEVQKITDRVIKEVEDLSKKKEKEIMEI